VLLAGAALLAGTTLLAGVALLAAAALPVEAAVLAEAALPAVVALLAVAALLAAAAERAEAEVPLATVASQTAVGKRTRAMAGSRLQPTRKPQRRDPIRRLAAMTEVRPRMEGLHLTPQWLLSMPPQIPKVTAQHLWSMVPDTLPWTAARRMLWPRMLARATRQMGRTAWAPLVR